MHNPSTCCWCVCVRINVRWLEVSIKTGVLSCTLGVTSAPLSLMMTRELMARAQDKQSRYNSSRHGDARAHAGICDALLAMKRCVLTEAATSLSTNQRLHAFTIKPWADPEGHALLSFATASRTWASSRVTWALAISCPFGAKAHRISFYKAPSNAPA